MSDVFISIRNQNGNALTSVGGIPFVANLKQDGQIVAQQAVALRFATADFYDLPLGQYITSVRPFIEIGDRRSRNFQAVHWRSLASFGNASCKAAALPT